VRRKESAEKGTGEVSGDGGEEERKGWEWESGGGRSEWGVLEVLDEVDEERRDEVDQRRVDASGGVV
jgi:hypothetical protein